MATTEQDQTPATAEHSDTKAAPQPGMTPAEPERPEDIVVNDGRDEDRPGNPLSRFFARLRGN